MDEMGFDLNFFKELSIMNETLEINLKVNNVNYVDLSLERPSSRCWLRRSMI